MNSLLFFCYWSTEREQDVSAKTFRQKKIRDVSAIFFCRNVRRHVFAETSFAETSFAETSFAETSCSPLGYVPISSSAPRPLGAAYMPILLSEVEQEQRPSRNGDREAIVVGAGLCDGEGERAYIAYIMRDLSANFLAWDVSAYFFLPKRPPPCFCRNVLCPNVRNSTEIVAGACGNKVEFWLVEWIMLMNNVEWIAYNLVEQIWVEFLSNLVELNLQVQKIF